MCDACLSAVLVICCWWFGGWFCGFVFYFVLLCIAGCWFVLVCLGVTCWCGLLFVFDFGVLCFNSVGVGLLTCLGSFACLYVVWVFGWVVGHGLQLFGFVLSVQG